MMQGNSQLYAKHVDPADGNKHSGNPLSISLIQQFHERIGELREENTRLEKEKSENQQRVNRLEEQQQYALNMPDVGPPLITSLKRSQEIQSRLQVIPHELRELNSMLSELESAHASGAIQHAEGSGRTSPKH